MVGRLATSIVQHIRTINKLNDKLTRAEEALRRVPADPVRKRDKIMLDKLEKK